MGFRIIERHRKKDESPREEAQRDELIRREAERFGALSKGDREKNTEHFIEKCNFIHSNLNEAEFEQLLKRFQERLKNNLTDPSELPQEKLEPSIILDLL
ncbi:MAG: hypothetical protein HQK54_11320 [Oligoflexales bacterium]|nr:hypothetical protein [Oligoflexales bacterium]